LNIKNKNIILFIIDEIIYNKLNTFIYSSNNDSTIHIDHISIYYKSKKIIINKYKKNIIIYDKK
jgi:hypothetical protein